MATKESLGVTAIIVTYHPSLLHLNKVIERIFPDVDSILVVDNHSPEISRWKIPQKFKNKIHTIKLPDNWGIGYAQNRGIEWAHKKKSQYVLFLDQDSLPTKGMTQKLKSALQKAAIYKKQKILAAGAVVVDLKTKKQTPFLIHDQARFAKMNANAVRVKTLISSGMLVDQRAFQWIGGMRSDYFIDHVDTEWIFRLNNKGYGAMGVNDAILYHTVGEKIIETSIFNIKIKFISHRPLRNYYKIRNHFFLYKDSKKLHLGIYIGATLLSLYFILFDDNRWPRLKFIFFAFWHGLFNIRGKLDIKTMKCTKIPLTTLDLT
jgi:rhamnosyltransferase